MTSPRTVLTAPPAAPEILARCRELVAPALTEAIDGLHPWVAEMAGYALGRREVGGAPATRRQGKGVRQALAVLGAEAAGGSAEAGVPGAVAVELLHTFSLLHDDIMDGDALRRGRPAVWKAYGTGPAVLTGDALFALAVETLTAAPATSHAAAAVRRLTRASRDLVRGQADDLLFAHRPWTGPDAVSAGEYEAMAEHKTGALLGCALALGAGLAGAPQETAAALDRAGRHLGVAFQIADDLLGIWGDPAVTGKPVHGDLRQGKKTLPVLAALAAPGRSPLAGLLASTAVLDEGAVRRAATLVERAGGRTAALGAARRHLTAADTLLAGASLAPRPAADLRTLLSSLAHRTI
ncbi:polyprenyl synthetase family protein [Streptomyces mirabilis]|uniref:Geranylgeranyl diphosphate synthase, type I n=1 Tax=Streptomyces mirabilis TaxID=68239 RepID=A0A1I2AX78_9ACTN|nr:polyprenyl synthetase family protein [Streptomyces mirabilis]SFE48369.1 geranylgeranyl diphosphate synthase, type I [Streptomyces mirabilis]